MKQYSRVTDQGTAMSEATLCGEHFVQPYIDYANHDADAADDVSTDRQWYDSSENDCVTCYECGLNAAAERLDDGIGGRVASREEQDYWNAVLAARADYTERGK